MSGVTTRRIFVGGIPVRVDKDQLVEFFSKFGQVSSCKRKKNTKSGRAFGYAFITFEKSEAAEAIVSQQVVFMGRILECKAAVKSEKLKEDLDERRRRRLVVFGLDPKTTNDDLIKAFKEMCSISHAFVQKESEASIVQLVGHVVFQTDEEISNILQSQPKITILGKSIEYYRLSEAHNVDIKATKVLPIQAKVSSHNVIPAQTTHKELTRMTNSGEYKPDIERVISSFHLAAPRKIKPIKSQAAEQARIGLGSSHVSASLPVVLMKLPDSVTSQAELIYSAGAQQIDAISKHAVKKHMYDGAERCEPLFEEAEQLSTSFKKLALPRIVAADRTGSFKVKEDGIETVHHKLNEEFSNYRFNIHVPRQPRVAHERKPAR